MPDSLGGTSQQEVCPMALATPTPGLDGTLRDTCVSCLRGTDTALGIEGEPEWHAAFLVATGIPSGQAIALAEYGMKEIGLDVRDQFTSMYRVCSKCVRLNMPRPGLCIEGEPIPLLRQPAEVAS